MLESLESGVIFAGRYRVERELGRGGLGVVYACEHIHTGQKVALKLLLAQPQRSPELEAAVREKFELEQKVWSHAPSEHIVRVLDAGNLDASQREAGAGVAGTPYMVMELLHGETLQQRVERLRLLPPAEVSGVLQQIALGLDVAHGCRGPDGRPAPIVHRDLTPRNVFVTTRADGSLWVKLLDFGIAKHLVDGAIVTQVMLGTRLYSAPEQLLGHPISPQTDVWALGLIAYYALTGREYGPLSGPQPVSPSRRRREQGVGGRFPIEFDHWFSRCIEREPARRFASAGEAAAELAIALAGAEQLVPPPLADDVRHAALVSTVPQPPARPELMGSAEVVRAAALAEPVHTQPARLTARLQHAGAPAPAAPFSTAEARSSLEGLKNPATPGSPLVVDIGGSRAASSVFEPQRVRWVALTLAAAVAGATFYVAWPEGAVKLPPEPPATEIAVTATLPLTGEDHQPEEVKAPSPGKTSSQDSSSSQQKAASQAQPPSQDNSSSQQKAASQDKPSSQDEGLSQDKPSSPDEPSSQDKAIPQDETTAQDKAPSQDNSLSQGKAPSQDNSHPQEKEPSQEKPRSSATVEAPPIEPAPITRPKQAGSALVRPSVAAKSCEANPATCLDE
jgi:serine/threonine protein kinase